MDRPRAVGYFELAAELGDASALFWMGHVLHHGDAMCGVSQDPARSLKYLHQAAGLWGCRGRSW